MAIQFKSYVILPAQSLLIGVFLFSIANSAPLLAQDSDAKASCDNRYQEMSERLSEARGELGNPEEVENDLEDAYKRCLEGDAEALEEVAADSRHEKIFRPMSGE